MTRLSDRAGESGGASEAAGSTAPVSSATRHTESDRPVHVPGPWSFVIGEFNAQAKPGAIGSIVDDAEGRYLAEIWGDYEAAIDEKPVAGIVPFGTGDATARLIAAAPDLLTAAKAIEETCPCDCDINPQFYAAWRSMIAAIKKAEGR